MIPRARTRLRHVRRVGALALVVATLLAGCGLISNTLPAATAGPFPTIAGQLSLHGIQVTGIVSGDAGCADANLAKTAIGFEAVGPAPGTPVRPPVSNFNN